MSRLRSRALAVVLVLLASAAVGLGVARQRCLARNGTFFWLDGSCVVGPLPIHLQRELLRT